ncbi:unnamed protein product, partial [Anisakis simplex]|uniref:Secreted protein n=1 Tax=Anisakis simplex TaxID=6269 RepID=A0A0M3JEQ1_ANISI
MLRNLTFALFFSLITFLSGQLYPFMPPMQPIQPAVVGRYGGIDGAIDPFHGAYGRSPYSQNPYGSTPPFGITQPGQGSMYGPIDPFYGAFGKTSHYNALSGT